MSNLVKFPSRRRLKRLPTRMRNADFTPISWTKYFEDQQKVFVKGNEFQVYSCGGTGPVLLMIHGGGYSALTWSLLVKEITKIIDAQVFAVDLRGHGGTKTNDEDNLALEVFVADIVELAGVIFGETNPPVVLIGHSLGGSIAVGAASLIPNVVGVCVIDVVEGTAVAALSSMHSILRNRPKGFETIEQAINWSYGSGKTHNLEAARVSMPGQIKMLQTAEECYNPNHAHKCPQNGYQLVDDTTVEVNKNHLDSVPESLNLDHAEHGFGNPSSEKPAKMFLKPPKLDSNLYGWRIDLSKTEPYWNGWFKGLSQKFLDVPAPKLLILANIHGLDTTLIIGQMQGKFQLQVLPQSGHAIHEDQPCRVAKIIAKFLVTQRIASSKSCISCTTSTG